MRSDSLVRPQQLNNSTLIYCPVPEDYPKGPLSPYGVSKLCSEYYLYYYHRIHGLPYIALRYGNVYGPRQDPHGEAGGAETDLLGCLQS